MRNEVEMPPAEEMFKKAGGVYDKIQKFRTIVKEAIETAADNGSYWVEVTGKIPDPIVDELRDLGYRVVYQGEDAPIFWGGYNTIITWRIEK